ncbi:hypothetical protein GTH32_11265 [Alteromonas sp. 345S023]|uniref:NIPSNAP domain-containing protein n=1 Tax=Alteromonas profundi TaxID=2696062 RepID=A0A7X5LLZ3_9ALTE|nr:hypothetical protein [Alteromonas profundi]NDV91764.1 hypothetical protein [Alteromonas profundi]
MKRTFKLFIVVVAYFIAVTSFNTMADERVFKEGNYWEIAAIEVKDGHWLNYGNHLANEWRSSMEFAKSKGWIVDYKVISNLHPRDGEASLYLLTIFTDWASEAENEERYAAWIEWSKKSLDKMEEQSGERVTMRRIMGEQLMQELTFRN